jgi:hypothetical protein
MLKECIQRLKNKFKCLYSKTTSYENQSEWGWDANGSPISEEGKKFNKDYDTTVESVQKHIAKEE